MSLLDVCTVTDDIIAVIDCGANLYFFNMNEKNQNGWTPLHFACHRGQTAKAVSLIERGANMNEKTQDGWSPLYFACRYGHIHTAVALTKNGANMNEKDEDGRTPIYYACNWGQSAMAMALLENGAVCMNDKDTFGQTPSFFACLRCSPDVVLQMIKNGAILSAAELQSFRDRSTVTDEQACTVEDAYKRELNWRRRALYAIFLSSIKDLVKHERTPSTPASFSDNSEMGSDSAEGEHARLMRVIDRVLCRTDMQRLIGSFL